MKDTGCGKGCGGECTGCGPHIGCDQGEGECRKPSEGDKSCRPDNKPEERPWGSSLASEAIKKMEKKERAEKEEECDGYGSEDVTSFVVECLENGRDPVEVAKKIAADEGISLNIGRFEPETDDERLSLKKFLIEVIATVAATKALVAIDKGGVGAFDLINNVLCGGSDEIPVRMLKFFSVMRY